MVRGNVVGKVHQQGCVTHKSGFSPPSLQGKGAGGLGLREAGQPHRAASTKRDLFAGRRGQVLVLFAVLVPVLVLFFFFALGLAALLDARAHAQDALAMATRAGARYVVYAGYGDGEVRFAEDVEERVRDVFVEALALRPAGLDGAAEQVAAELVVEVGYGAPGTPWPSPFVPGRTHIYPTVAARVLLPVRVWMFAVRVPVVSETEVR